MPTINIGDYIVIKKQAYKKLHKVQKGVTVKLGKHQIDVSNIVSQPYNSEFKLEKGRNNIFTLSKVECSQKVVLPSAIECGDDNRNIRSDGKSQKLSHEEISELQEKGLAANDIIGTLVTNSTTFTLKTQYSQEKYLKKKEKKYYEYVQILKPCIVDLIDIYYRLNPVKILGLRIDDIAQILYYSNVNCYGNHLIYESGTCGLVVAAMLERIGSDTTGQLVHIHPGNEPQKQALMAMQFPSEQMHRYINVNLYSILRHYHQKFKNSEPVAKKAKIDSEVKWQEDNQRVCQIFDEQKCDSFVVIAKENPCTIIDAFIDFVNTSRPIVVFSERVETLMETYMHLKLGKKVTNLMLTNNFMREIQVLPNRTHPNVNIDFGGYILYGYVVAQENVTEEAESNKIE